ncbi:sugar fermentation stimulation protein SfsA [Peptoclostridium acidaminophilum DSM 3953]|uniref:Sugar fermentation stimulation protein homolog n=1 Tax=Peptoclostridium acidaminophilum DSM 3953 TaxID=1286171 RepID=W8TDR3_PEPAC|nr:DNA/RNA nuclease SfsA [Peptoclostridium acidaminophilum]AHM55963.1 sugar fermentation stimulation protein SfsA [Peptoclostridium acidaminophilum DSM 3953]
MIYDNIKKGIFISRPNRFIAHVEIDGKVEICHVKNTGRCKELLTEGANVIVQDCGHPGRKTRYDLISVWKGERLINIDSQAPNTIFLEWLKSGKYIRNLKLIKPEQKYGNSRFDYYLETSNRKIFVEVKGVTLEDNGVVLFPDAPTERGVKHLKELAACIDEGYEAMVVFVVQMKGVRYMTPNERMHPEFGNALRLLSSKGAKILAIDCSVTEEAINPESLVKVRLT